MKWTILQKILWFDNLAILITIIFFKRAVIKEMLTLARLNAGHTKLANVNLKWTKPAWN
jgi:hypothetical protein